MEWAGWIRNSERCELFTDAGYAFLIHESKDRKTFGYSKVATAEVEKTSFFKDERR